ncbi:E3 ubiquitin-protein ligase Ubr3 [Bombyx mori]|uniref:E3 ubiquitin-protein ligase n=1 Tax=Bombyx mori TaxID=7091 RepID=A0A8R2QTE2_BOMMO|nr:E3 ubiquitin-protein ligase Ubr3 isoform X1 [Bombyx mori]
MANSTAQVLMKKGKRGAAAYIHADCSSGSPQHLGPLLDVLLNPSKAIDEWETIDWCRWLLAGGRTPDEFAAVVRSYDKHDKCGLVWIPRVVAYRCRTCGISPCMSICRECFHRGDHSTHDFNMFLSQAGGACDCGDKSVMKEDGFCSNHGNKCPRPGTVPAELMCVAEAMMPRLILRLLQHFRENSSGSQTNSDRCRIAVQECEGYVQMLMEFNNMGDLMRSAMTKALINPQMYRNLVVPPFPDTEYGAYMAESHHMYERALDLFPAPEPPDEYCHLPALAPRLTHNTLLEEFIFWTFKYEFPQNVVCFLLNMLPDQDYKEHLTRTFVLHYGRIPLVLEAAADPDTLSNRVVHMSVQLFSNEALALRCVQHLHLLHVMVLSLRLMMAKILVQNTLHDPRRNYHRVIDCTQKVMKEHCYWPLVSDFNNVLSHKSVALLFLQDDALIDMWFEFLSMLQGMNVNVRETGGHIEFEPSSYYAAFSCELEAAAYPMWSVLSHLTAPEHAPLARRMLGAALGSLRAWLGAVQCTELRPERDAAMRASFHFPLHRYLAAFLCAAVRWMGVRAADVLPPAPLLALLAAHPLRVQSLFYEILAGVWVRNGLQIKGQAMTYIQANFCNSMVDMDIYWLQICAAHLPPDQFMDMCIDMFGVREWLSMLPMSPVQAAEQDAMVEGLLTFLAILVSSRTNLGNDELTQSRLEVSTLLAAGDKTHSQLLELMPERSGNAHTKNFETVLKELSTYRPPPRGSENLEQGLFVPRPVVWEQYYDPLHVLRRAVHRRDFHASMERYTAYVREKRKGAGSAARLGTLWPPLRAPPGPAPPGAGDPRAVCRSGVLLGALLAVLHRAVHRRAADQPPPHAPPDHVLALALHLLDAALAPGAPADPRSAVLQREEGAARCVSGAALLRALGGACPTQAACTRVLAVPRPAPRPAPPAHYAPVDSDTEWESSELEPALLSLPTAPSTALAVPSPRQVARGDSMAEDRSDDADVMPYVRALEGIMEDESRALVLQDSEMSLALPAGPPRAPPPHRIDYDTEGPEWDDAPALPAPPHFDLPSTSNHDTQMELQNQTEEDSIPVNESIISLLLKLHSQLSGRLDSFSPDEPAPAAHEPVGDGPFWIGRVLRRMCSLDPRCRQHVQHVREQLWPQQRERHAEHLARERAEKEERSRRARERQEQVMREFAARQQRFLSSMRDMDDEEWVEEPLEPDYTCVICNTCAPASAADPVGLVVLVQASSVLAHRAPAGCEPARLPLTEPDRARLRAHRDRTAGQHQARVLDELRQHFDGAGVDSWEGGVHVQSCQHHLHLHCLHAYLRALHAPRPHNLHVERGEFLCPLCRQLANTVLPLAPRPARPPRLPLPAALPEPAPQPAPTKLSEAMGKAMEDITAAAGGKLKQRYGSSPADIFAFVTSLVRTNLECELVQRGGTLLTASAPRYKPRNECIVPLMVVAGFHSRVLSAAGAGLGVADTWRLVSPPPAAPAPAGPAPAPALAPAPPSDARPVPILLKDPLDLLIQLLLVAPPDPPHVDIQDFNLIVRQLYTLTYYQIVCQFCANATPEERAALAAGGGGDDDVRTNARVVLAALADSELFTEDGPPAQEQPAPMDFEKLEEELKRLSLPFLRVCALLRHHMYGAALPDVAAPEQEYARLAQYLDLGAAGRGAAGRGAARGWARQLGAAAQRSQLGLRRLLRAQHVEWAPPALLALPHEYDRLFTHYHERVCSQCGAAPKEASVCLACGTLVCLKAACCRRHQVAEAVRHAAHCGAGTAIFLVVTSTYIIVIRGRRACLWGSLYLDDYDEEDRDLKRGKPLYLSRDRLELLQAQWLAHRFDHTKRTWVWHRDSL